MSNDLLSPEHDESHPIIDGERSLERAAARIRLKADLTILPLCLVIYFLSFLDRTNIANARVAGLQRDLKITDYEYTVALTVTYVPYVLSEIPSTLLQNKIGPHVLIPCMMCLWGLVTILQGFVYNYSGLLACRFFLGLAEGGLLPGIVLYLSNFYRREDLHLRVSIVIAGTSLSGAFSGLLAAAIGLMNGIRGLPGWAWIFILEGIVSFLFGCFCFFALPRGPTHMRSLNAEEKDLVVTILQNNGIVAEDAEVDTFSWREVGRAFLLPQVWFSTVIFFGLGATLYGLAYFEPVIVAGFGYSPTNTQLFSVPPFAVAFIVSVASAILSDRYGCRGLVVIISSVLAIAGFVIFLVSNDKQVQYGSLFLSVTGVFTGAPAAPTWTANNTAPQVRRATAIGIAFTQTNAGGILATWLLGSLSPPPHYYLATKVFIALSVAVGVFSAINLAYLTRANRQKEVSRQTVAKKDEDPMLGNHSAYFVYKY